MMMTSEDASCLPLHPSVALPMGIRFLSQIPLYPSVAKFMGIQYGTTTINNGASPTKSTMSPAEMEPAMSAMSQVDMALKLNAKMLAEDAKVCDDDDIYKELIMRLLECHMELETNRPNLMACPTKKEKAMYSWVAEKMV
jgi:hypothetical protein